jgi:hypothetical protein
MANQSMMDLIVTPCWVMAVKISSKDDVGSFAGVLHFVSDSGMNFV